MPSATSYSILTGTNLVVSVLNALDEPLINLADAAPDTFTNGPNGKRKVAMFLQGFSSAVPADSNVRVRIKMPEPIVVDALGNPSPKFGVATPWWSISPATDHNSQYYGTSGRPVVFNSFSNPPLAPGNTLREIDISVDMQTPLGGTPFGVMLLVGWGHSITA